MNRLIGILLLIVIVVGGILWWNSNKNVVENTPNTEETDNDETGKIEVVLGEQNASGEKGTATLENVDGKAKVTLNVTGVPAGIEQPAHIHANLCANIGAVKYQLSNVVNGKSETTLLVSVEQLITELPLSINVHKSAAEISKYVACGDIGGTAATSTETTVVVPKTVAVTYSANGFTPATFEINKGDTVTFANQSGGQMWVASGPHPAHTNYSDTTREQHCPDTADTSFDQCTAVAAGQSYSFTFQKTGTWKYHNHVGAGDFGTIVVQ